MTFRSFPSRLIVTVILTCALQGCWGGEYERLEGCWQGELKGQRIQAEFHPSEDVVILDGRPGSMRLGSEDGAVLALAMTGPDGRSGEAVITVLDERRIRLEIPRANLAVELERRD